jgi:hypothetical protein
LSLVAPVRFSSEELSIPVVIKFSIMARKEEHEMSSVFLVKNKHLSLGIPLCDLFRSRESFFVRFVFSAVRIVKEVTAVAVDYAYDYIARQESSFLPRGSLTGGGRRIAA